MKYLLKTNKNPKTNFQCAGVHAYLVSFMLFSVDACVDMCSCVWGGICEYRSMWHMCVHTEVKSHLGCCFQGSDSLVINHIIHWPETHQLGWTDRPMSLGIFLGLSPALELWVPPCQYFYMGSGGHSGHCTPVSFVDLSVSLATYTLQQFSERPNVIHS